MILNDHVIRRRIQQAGVCSGLSWRSRSCNCEIQERATTTPPTSSPMGVAAGGAMTRPRPVGRREGSCEGWGEKRRRGEGARALASNSTVGSETVGSDGTRWEERADASLLLQVSSFVILHLLRVLYESFGIPRISFATRHFAVPFLPNWPSVSDKLKKWEMLFTSLDFFAILISSSFNFNNIIVFTAWVLIFLKILFPLTSYLHR